MSGPVEHPWPVFGRDPQGTRRSPADTSGNTGKLRWRLALGTPQLSSPVISQDGTVYVSSADRILYAVAPPTAEEPAALKWTYTLPPPDVRDSGASTPAIGPDGTVYVSTSDIVYALGAPTSGTEGVLKWSYRDPDSFQGRFYFDSLGAPTVGTDGTVYIAGRKLLALDPQGNGFSGVLKWSSERGGGTQYPPTIAPDGTVFPSSGNLMAIQPPVRGTNGTLAWSFPEARLQSPPAIATDGTAYVAGYDQYVRAVTPPASGTSGVLKWSYHTDSLEHTAPAIGSDGTVYVAAGVYGLFALNPNAAGSDGEVKWRYYHNDNKWWSRWPAVGADGTIYVAGRVAISVDKGTGNVHAISPPVAGSAGRLKWVFQTDGAQVSAPAIGADGTVYVTADDTLYAIQ